MYIGYLISTHHGLSRFYLHQEIFKNYLLYRLNYKDLVKPLDRNCWEHMDIIQRHTFHMHISTNTSETAVLVRKMEKIFSFNKKQNPHREYYRQFLEQDSSFTLLSGTFDL